MEIVNLISLFSESALQASIIIVINGLDALMLYLWCADVILVMQWCCNDFLLWSSEETVVTPLGWVKNKLSDGLFFLCYKVSRDAVWPVKERPKSKICFECLNHLLFLSDAKHHHKTIPMKWWMNEFPWKIVQGLLQYVVLGTDGFVPEARSQKLRNESYIFFF